MSMTFKMGEITKLIDVDRNRLKEWIARGWVKPSIKRASGHGTPNVFDRENLYEIALFKKMIESGLSRAVIGDFIGSAQRSRAITQLATVVQAIRIIPLSDELQTGVFRLPEEIEKRNPKEAKIIKDTLLQVFREFSHEVMFYLAFVRGKDGFVKSWGIVDGYPVEGGDEPATVKLAKKFCMPSMENLPEILSFAEDAHLYNFGEIVDRIENRLVRFYPEKVKDLAIEFRQQSNENFACQILPKFSDFRGSKEEKRKWEYIEHRHKILEQELTNLRDSEHVDPQKLKALKHDFRSLQEEIDANWQRIFRHKRKRDVT